MLRAHQTWGIFERRFWEFMSGTHSQLGSGMTRKESGVVARDQRPQATGSSEHAQMKFGRVARQFRQPEPPTALGLAFEMTRFNQSQPIGGSNVPLENSQDSRRNSVPANPSEGALMSSAPSE